MYVLRAYVYVCVRACKCMCVLQIEIMCCVNIVVRRANCGELWHYSNWRYCGGGGGGGGSGSGGSGRDEW